MEDKAKRWLHVHVRGSDPRGNGKSLEFQMNFLLEQVPAQDFILSFAVGMFTLALVDGVRKRRGINSRSIDRPSRPSVSGGRKVRSE